MLSNGLKLVIFFFLINRYSNERNSYTVWAFFKTLVEYISKPRKMVNFKE